MFGIIFLALFVGLIWLLVRAIKRSKRKLAEQKEQLGEMSERQKVIEESLITTGYPPQNIPTTQTSFLQMLILGILISPIGLFITVYIVKSTATKQQNRVKEARSQRGITLSPEAYAASEAYFDKQRREADKAILPGILAWVILVAIIFIVTKN